MKTRAIAPNAGNWYRILFDILDDFGPKIGDTAIAVYNVLMRRATTKGIAWPSATTIGKAIGVSRNTVYPALDRLEMYGLIVPIGIVGNGAKKYQIISPLFDTGYPKAKVEDATCTKSGQVPAQKTGTNKNHKQEENAASVRATREAAKVGKTLQGVGIWHTEAGRPWWGKP